jgi:hypothetical protein
LSLKTPPCPGAPLTDGIIKFSSFLLISLVFGTLQANLF